MDRASFSAGSQAGAHRGNQTIAQMAGAREKAVYDRLRHTVIGLQIAARSDVFGLFKFVSATLLRGCRDLRYRGWLGVPLVLVFLRVRRCQSVACAQWSPVEPLPSDVRVERGSYSSVVSSVGGKHASH